MDPEPQRVLVERDRRAVRDAQQREVAARRAERDEAQAGLQPLLVTVGGRAAVPVGSEQARRDGITTAARTGEREPDVVEVDRGAEGVGMDALVEREARPAVPRDRAEMGAAAVEQRGAVRSLDADAERRQAQLGAQLERGLLHQQQPQRGRRVRDPRRRFLAEAQRDRHRVAGQLDPAVQTRSEAGRHTRGVPDELQPQRLGELERVVVGGESCDRPQNEVPRIGERDRDVAPVLGEQTDRGEDVVERRAAVPDARVLEVDPADDDVGGQRQRPLLDQGGGPAGSDREPRLGEQRDRQQAGGTRPQRRQGQCRLAPGQPEAERRSQPEPEHLLGRVRQLDLHDERGVRLAAREPGGHARDVHRADREVEHRDLQCEAVPPGEGDAGRGARDRRRPARRLGRRRDGAGKARGLPGRGQGLGEPGRCEPLERSRLPQRAQLCDVAGERRVAGPAVEVERLGDRQRRLDDRGVGGGQRVHERVERLRQERRRGVRGQRAEAPEVRQQVDPREPGPAHGRRGAEGDLAAGEAELDLQAPGDGRQRDVRHDPPAGCQVTAAVDGRLEFDVQLAVAAGARHDERRAGGQRDRAGLPGRADEEPAGQGQPLVGRHPRGGGDLLQERAHALAVHVRAVAERAGRAQPRARVAQHGRKRPDAPARAEQTFQARRGQRGAERVEHGTCELRGEPFVRRHDHDRCGTRARRQRELPGGAVGAEGEPGALQLRGRRHRHGGQPSVDLPVESQPGSEVEPAGGAQRDAPGRGRHLELERRPGDGKPPRPAHRAAQPEQPAGRVERGLEPGGEEGMGVGTQRSQGLGRDARGPGVVVHENPEGVERARELRAGALPGARGGADGRVEELFGHRIGELHERRGRRGDRRVVEAGARRGDDGVSAALDDEPELRAAKPCGRRREQPVARAGDARVDVDAMRGARRLRSAGRDPDAERVDADPGIHVDAAGGRGRDVELSAHAERDVRRRRGARGAVGERRQRIRHAFERALAEQAADRDRGNAGDLARAVGAREALERVAQRNRGTSARVGLPAVEQVGQVRHRVGERPAARRRSPARAARRAAPRRRPARRRR